MDKLEPKQEKTYRTLFLTTLFLSAFTFGGGYVIVPLMKKKFVEKLGWVDEKEILNLVALAQSAPGPIAVNTSILLGYETFGALGAVVALLGTILPPLIILSFVSLFYQAFKTNHLVKAILHGMQAGIVAVIFDVVYKMVGGIVQEKSIFRIFIMILAFLASWVWKLNIILILLSAAFLGCLETYLNRKRK